MFAVLRERGEDTKERKRSDIFFLPSSHLAHSLPSAHTMPQNISLVPTALIDLGNKSKEGATVDECFFLPLGYPKWRRVHLVERFFSFSWMASGGRTGLSIDDARGHVSFSHPPNS